MSRPASEEKTGDTRPMGAKALGAMEVAARRARESRTIPLPVHDPHTPPGRPTAGVDPPDVDEGPRRREIVTVPPERWLAVAVGVAALLVIVAAIALVVSLSSSSGPVAAPPGTHGTTHTGGTATPPASHTSGTAAAPQTTSTLPSLGTPGGAPVIGSLSPSSGNAGQTVQVSGSNFLSSDGQIVATFAGQVAATSCPTQTTCTVTVPTRSAPAGPVPVTITTSAGTSNPLTFTYG